MHTATCPDINLYGNSRERITKGDHMKARIMVKGAIYGALAWVVFNTAAQLYYQYLIEWSNKVYMGP